jgi:hypothetical protein
VDLRKAAGMLYACRLSMRMPVGKSGKGMLEFKTTNFIITNLLPLKQQRSIINNRSAAYSYEV